MALELVATAFLSVAFEKLIDRFTSSDFASFFRGKKTINDQLKVFYGKLETISLFLDDAEDKQLFDKKVKEWLDDLKEVIFKVNDLVEEINSEARSNKESNQSNKRNFSSMIKPFIASFTEFDNKVLDDVVKFSEDLEILSKRAGFLRLNQATAQTTRSSVHRLPAPLREERFIFGRDAEKKKILDLLLSRDECVWGNKIGVLPIVGMGGVGKTTLTQLVYNDERLKEHEFKLKAWVTVSTEFDVSRILKTLLKEIGNPIDTNELATLQRKMQEALRGKNFLFVLDDIWDENYGNWDLLKSNFTTGDSRSRIMVTTRSRKVCSIVKSTETIHEVEFISEDDCWEIFVHHAFGGDKKADPKLQTIGKTVVHQCKRVPLAVISAAGLLRSVGNDHKKWESIQRNPVWKLTNNPPGNGVLPSLWLSYRYLPSSVKQCFAYCAIFPQDYTFNKEEMVLLWMAQGFLHPDQKETSLEEVGNQYFEELISRSFFQRHESSYVMHDLVHDLATFVSGEFCISLSGNKKLGSTSSKTRHLFCNDDELEFDSVEPLGGTYLHTYICEAVEGLATESLCKKVLEAGMFIRALSITYMHIPELLSSPANHLKHLRYLNLSYSDIEDLPDSICSLHNLQSLILVNCDKLSSLPPNMGKLINLRHFKTTATDQLKEMPPRMGNLKELRTLSHFVVGEADNGSCSGIQELGKLQHLWGQLHVRGLQNVQTADAARRANFIDKENLTKLVLEWKNYPIDTGSEKEVLDALKPNKNLESLSISGYAASSFPNWVGESSFSKLVSVQLQGNMFGSLCSWLPPLGQLPSLKMLDIGSFHRVKKIGSEFYGNNSCITPFQSLETLRFGGMVNWKEWSFGDRDGKENGCFPRLKFLRISASLKLGVGSLLECQTLETLDIRYSYESMECFQLDKFPSLKSLTLYNCPNMKSLTNQKSLPLSLTSLDISYCPQMESFPDGGLPTLTSLKISYCPQMESFPEEGFPSLTSLVIRDCSDTLSFPEGGFPTLTSLKINGCPHTLSFPEGGFPSLTSLYIYGCPDTLSFPEGGFPKLTSLYIHGCPDTLSFPEAKFPKLTFKNVYFRRV